MTHKQGDAIIFSPDLARNATFLVQKIEPLTKEAYVQIHLKYIKGRWAPDNRDEIFKLEVPKDFTTEDIECAWFDIPNFRRLSERS